MALLVIVWQLSMKYRRIISVGISIGMYFEIYKKNNLLIVKNLNKKIKMD
jgi:hypothetical protein